ncbi:hypothetical protein [Frankia sp. R82]|uniref:hypothetical protein n=1 Tax=Frankia sp. R82 TaxID=2950553 RepID=UPI002043B10F|nr:hypothetical protein [Frankia sp. R82]MCM3884295.1 hypothetical protein [Frankia sp. R82]
MIASDCGESELARNLCWRQHEVFNQARLPTSVIELSLQPVLNLPRQLIREGDGDGAYAMLRTLYHAARNRIDTVIDERSVNLRDITRGHEDHRVACAVIWAAFLADGARALTQAGRWREAAEHAAAHRGVGVRLLDGRQVTILALVQDGQTERAATMVEQSAASESSWEPAVQSLLRVYCMRAAGAEVRSQIPPMLAAVLAMLGQPDPPAAVFRGRTGMVALDLAGGHDHPHLSPLRTALINGACGDAYAARDALAHRLLAEALSATERETLADLARASGLDAGALPHLLRNDLTDAFAIAENHLRECLGRHAGHSPSTTAKAASTG